MLLVWLAPGCTDSDATRVSAHTPAGGLRVLAAASLSEAFSELGRVFEGRHPNVEITFNFAASSALAEQLNAGAPGDVFASADEANMRKVTDRGTAADPKVIARNRLAILVERGNPRGVAGLADLADPDLVLVLCAPEVPCGRLAAAALAKAGVRVRPASLEENVKAVVSKVTLGEADAGIVYATDVKAAGDEAQGVHIGIASDPDLEAVYPMAVTRATSNREAAQAWLDFVLSAEAQSILRTHGFVSP